MVRKMRTQFGIALIIITCAGTVQAQLNSFFYTNNSLVNLNPSFAGSNGNLRDQGFAGNSSPGVYSGMRVFYNAIDLYLPSIESGLAFTGYYEDFGNSEYQTKSYSISYAKYFSLRNDKIKFVPSLQVGLRQVRSQILTYTSPPGQPWFWEKGPYANDHLTIALGGLFTIKNFYFGASFYNFQPITRREQYNPLLDRYNVHASYNLRLAKWALFHFSGNLSVNSFSYSTLNLGLNVLLFKHFLFGAGIIRRESSYFNAGFRHHCFSVCLGYDRTLLSGFVPYTHEGFTAMATFNLRKKELRKEVLNFEAW